MKVMVIGGGGREHAVIKALRKNSSIDEIFALPGNGGIAEDAICVDIGATQTDEITDFAVKNKIDYAVVRADSGCRRNREQQGFRKGAHEKIRHSHRRVRSVRR